MIHMLDAPTSIGYFFLIVSWFVVVIVGVEIIDRVSLKWKERKNYARN